MLVCYAFVNLHLFIPTVVHSCTVEVEEVEHSWTLLLFVEHSYSNVNLVSSNISILLNQKVKMLQYFLSVHGYSFYEATLSTTCSTISLDLSPSRQSVISICILPTSFLFSFCFLFLFLYFLIIVIIVIIIVMNRDSSSSRTMTHMLYIHFISPNRDSEKTDTDTYTYIVIAVWVSAMVFRCPTPRVKL